MSSPRLFSIVTLLSMFVCLAPPARASFSDPPSASESMRCFRQVERWIRDLSAPPEPAPADPARCAGASVTLRIDHDIIGRGVSMRTDSAAAWDAARLAIADAKKRSPAPSGGFDASFSKRITIELQLAGALVPLPVVGTVSDAAWRISPGAEGLAARAGERIGPVFPGASLVANLSPVRVALAAVSELDLPNPPLVIPSDSLAKLRDQHGISYHRFSIQHLAQLGPDASPVFLHRGGAVVDIRHINAERLRRFAADLAAHIEQRRFPLGEPLGLLGVYRPWLDDYESPLAAPSRDQALAAFALARSAQLFKGDPAAAWIRALSALDTLSDLWEVAEGEPSPEDDPVAIALAAAAVVEIDELARRSPAPRGPLRDAVAHRITRATTGLFAQDSSRIAVLKNTDDLPAPERAVIAYAFVRLARSPFAERAHVSQDDARTLVRDLFRDTPPGALPAMTPWLGWAEIELAARDERIPAATALRDLRSIIWRHQLKTSDTGAAARDLAGGIVFTRAGAKLPDWNTLRPVALMATMLGDPRLTPREEFSSQLARLSASLRFTIQLSVRDRESRMSRNPARSFGGVRLSLWDQRQPLHTQAMALLAATEAITAVESRTRRTPPTKP